MERAAAGSAAEGGHAQGACVQYYLTPAAVWLAARSGLTAGQSVARLHCRVALHHCLLSGGDLAAVLRESRE